MSSRQELNAATETAALTPEQFTMLRDAVLSAADTLQMFKPGGLDKAAELIEADLGDAKTLLLSPVLRRRGEKFAAMLRAAEKFNVAAREVAASLKVLDPSER